MNFATDGNAFADHIYHYFNDTADEINIIQENKPCALNYVIVISDFINGRNVTVDFKSSKIIKTRHGC